MSRCGDTYRRSHPPHPERAIAYGKVMNDTVNVFQGCMSGFTSGHSNLVIR